LAHGAEEAGKAEQAGQALFSKGGSQAAVPTAEVPRAELEAGLPLFKLLVAAGLSKSGGEARRLVKQGGAYVNDEKMADANREFGLSDLDAEGSLLLRAGKKRYCKVVAV
jgi:tyrosyl-tRNA synthetase